MLPQVQKSKYIFRLINRLHSLNYGDKYVRYVTFTVKDKNSYFGTETAEGFREKLEGKIIVKAWKEIPVKFPNCTLGDYLLTPDTFSGIIMVDNSLTDESRMKTYIKALSRFKNRSTTLMNKLHGTHGRIFWENNFDEITVRDLYRIKEILTFFKSAA